VIDTKNLSKLGLGTWGFGGFKDFDPSADIQKQTEAIAHTLNHGINYVETTLWYAQGQTAEILAEGIKKSGVSRKDIFISQGLYHYDHQTLRTLKQEVGKFHHLLDTNYSDVLLLLMKGFNKYGFEPVCNWLQEELDAGRARYVGVSNADKKLLPKLYNRFGSKLFCHELHVNYEVRNMEDLGIIAEADKLGIRNVIAQPLRRNRTAAHNWPLLVELAEKYGVDQNQVILAWMIARNFLPLIKSESVAHIDKNLAAQDIILSGADIARLNSWRPDYIYPKIDWSETGEGISPDQLANVFDAEYAKQHTSN
jgi:2,5-diketo-D-gluconate reductase A